VRTHTARTAEIPRNHGKGGALHAARPRGWICPRRRHPDRDDQAI